MTNTKISLRILAAINSGMTIEQAINHVLGAGSFERIAADVYNALRA
jgi:hypothetical protein